MHRRSAHREGDGIVDRICFKYIIIYCHLDTLECTTCYYLTDLLLPNWTWVVLVQLLPVWSPPVHRPLVRLHIHSQFRLNHRVVQQCEDLAVLSPLRYRQLSLTNPQLRPLAKTPATPLWSKAVAFGCSFGCFNLQVTSFSDHTKEALDRMRSVSLQPFQSACKDCFF